MRLQWWRDALDRGGARRGRGPSRRRGADRHDRALQSAAAGCSTIFSRRARSISTTIAMPTSTDLEGYCGETCSALFSSARSFCAEGRDLGGADATGHAGVAYATVGLMRALPLTSARGQVFCRTTCLRAMASRATMSSAAATAAVCARRSPNCGLWRAGVSTRRSTLRANARAKSRRRSCRWPVFRCISPGWRAPAIRRSKRWWRRRNGAGNGRCGAPRGAM